MDDVGEELYIKLAEETDSKIQAEVLDFVQKKASSFFIENNAYGADMALGSLNSIASVLGDVKSIVSENLYGSLF